jgi:hypothetical protein
MLQNGLLAVQELDETAEYGLLWIPQFWIFLGLLRMVCLCDTAAWPLSDQILQIFTGSCKFELWETNVSWTFLELFFQKFRQGPHLIH